MQHTVIVSHTISMGHRLPSYNGICASLHGHNVKFEVTVQDDKFVDFKDVKTRLERILADFDHAMVLWENDPWLNVFLLLHPEIEKVSAVRTQFGEHRPGIAKAQAALRLVRLNVEPTTEALAQYIFNEMFIGAESYVVTLVVVHETDKYSAECRAVDNGVFRTA